MLKQILTCLKEHVSKLYSVFPIPMLQNWGTRGACIDTDAINLSEAWEPPKLGKKTTKVLREKRLFLEQLSQFGGTLRAIIRIAPTT